MERTNSGGQWKTLLIVVLALLLLALLAWLFLRPDERVRHVVFGDLGGRIALSNTATGSPGEAASMPRFANAFSNGVPVAANPPMTNESGQETNSQSNRPLEALPAEQGNIVRSSGAMTSSATMSNNAQSAGQTSTTPAHSAPLTPLAPRASRPAYSTGRDTHPKWVPEDTSPEDSARKDSTAKLLAEARAADMARVNPIPARTADLLGNDSQPWRLFDPEAGSNVVFVIDNSMSMMTNGKSEFVRGEVAQALQSMNNGKSFYVLFFHSGGYEGMPSLGPLAASSGNVSSITNWLFSVGFRTGADPTKAMLRAFGLAPAPDTVWLLSASSVPQDAVDNIRNANATANAHINTIGFYTRDGEEALRRIANENRGVYRFISPNSSTP